MCVDSVRSHGFHTVYAGAPRSTFLEGHQFNHCPTSPLRHSTGIRAPLRIPHFPPTQVPCASCQATEMSDCRASEQAPPWEAALGEGLPAGAWSGPHLLPSLVHCPCCSLPPQASVVCGQNLPLSPFIDLGLEKALSLGGKISHISPISVTKLVRTNLTMLPTQLRPTHHGL